MKAVEKLYQENVRLKEQCEEYLDQSTAYQLLYEDKIKPHRAILLMQGVITQLWSEVLSYRLKHGLNEKIEATQARIETLQGLCDDFSNISSENERQKILIQQWMIRHDTMVEKYNELNEKYMILEKTLNAGE